MSRRVTCHDTTQRIPAPHPTRWVRARLVGVALDGGRAGRRRWHLHYTYCYSAVDEQSSRLSPDGVTCGAGPVDPRHGTGLVLINACPLQARHRRSLFVGSCTGRGRMDRPPCVRLHCSLLLQGQGTGTPRGCSD